MKAKIDWNGIIMQITTEGQRIKFDFARCRCWMFRRFNTKAYNGGGESFSPIFSKKYDNEKAMCRDIASICKVEKIACPADVANILEA